MEKLLKLAFLEARTYRAWIKDKEVTDSDIKKIYDLMKFGPTSANCSPLRVLFLKTKESKIKLKEALDVNNVEQTMLAPFTAIFAYDLDFVPTLDFLFPHVDAKPWFSGKKMVQFSAFLNASLQGAYFIIAARLLGFDCGPMSGFKNEVVDKLFFKGTKKKSLFLCNIGYGDPKSLYPRGPRFPFDKVCKII